MRGEIEIKLEDFLKVCRFWNVVEQAKDTEEQKQANQARAGDITSKRLDLSLQHISCET